MGYEGIKNARTIKPISNYKIVFVDSESGLNLGFAFGNKPADSGIIQETEKISIPDRPGYEFVAGGLSYTKDGAEQGITVIDDKFTLDGDMINSAKNGVVTVKVVYNAAYNKLYTVQYIYDGKVVGIKSGCSENTTFSGIINKTLGSVTLDGETTLDSVVKPAAGYKFSKFTYGANNTEVVLSGGSQTTWADLIGSAVDGMITVCINYNRPYTVQYVCDGKVVGTKSGCSEDMANLSGVVESTLSNITLDGGKKLDVAAGDVALKAKGYTFSNFTYGNGQEYTAGTTKWENLKVSAVDGMITVYVNYNKPYTVQYVCDGKVVGIKSGCSEDMANLSGVVESTLSNITLDQDEQGNTKTLDVAAGDSDLQGKGYTFSNFTYGNGQTYTDGTTKWDDLKASAVDGMITVYVNYNKPYTVQYVCDNKVVGVKSSCSENTTFSDIINTDFSKISLDGDQKLKDVVKPAAGYKFSNFTYGKENKEVVLSGGTLTNWKDLTDSSFNGVVTVFLNYIDTASDTVKYVASGGHMILDKKSKMTNYSGVNLPIGGLRKVHEPKKVIFDFCGQTIHHNDPNVPFIQGVPGKHIVICNLNMDGGGCK